MKWGLLIYSMKSLLQTRTECYSRAADGRILNFHSELSFLLRFPNTYTVPLNHHAVTNVGPTRYLKENGWHYVGICRACWAKGVGPTSNQPLAIMSARWQKWHLANDSSCYASQIPIACIELSTSKMTLVNYNTQLDVLQTYYRSVHLCMSNTICFSWKTKPY